MASPARFPLSVADYVGDTTHLDLAQHGAYLLIMMAMWRAGGWLDDDDRLLANICKVSITRWAKIGGPVRKLLLAEDGKLTQKRLLSELKSAQKTINAKVQNGRTGGIAKSLKIKEPILASATPSLEPSHPPATSEENPHTSSLSFLLTSSESKSEIQEKKESKKGRSKKSQSLPLPDEWQPSPEDFNYGQDHGHNPQRVLSMAEDMRLWARANGIRKVDWTATFHGWMRREADKRGQNGHANHQTGTNRSGKSGQTNSDRILAGLARVAEKEFGYKFTDRPGDGPTRGPGGFAAGNDADRRATGRDGKAQAQLTFDPGSNPDKTS